MSTSTAETQTPDPSVLTPPPDLAPTAVLVDPNIDAQRRVRQKERTVDNLNRLFAMIFSIIFSVGFLAVINKIVAYLDTVFTNINNPAFDAAINPVTVGFDLGALAILGATAAIFFHQASRSLDLRFASSADIEPRPLKFLVEYLVIFLQMIPFVLMAKSLELGVTHKTGFIWFFLSHEILILFGLTLLVIQQLSDAFLHWGAPDDAARTVALGVRRYWFVMNAGYIVLTTLAFAILSGSFVGQQYCPTNPRVASLMFPSLFFVLAMGRNWLDFGWMWNVFYPVKGTGLNGEQIYRWPLSFLMEMQPIYRVGRVSIFGPMAFGYAFLVVTAYLTLFVTRIFDLGLWSRLCAG